jgi:hypothetical protein
MIDLEMQNIDIVVRRVWVTPAVITASIVKHSEGPQATGVAEGSTDDFGS